MTSNSAKNRQSTRRAKAEEMRRAAEAARLRKQRMIVALVAVAVLAIGAIIGVVVVSSKNDTSGPAALPATATGLDNGIVVGKASAPVTVDFYEDFQCPVCGEFEKTTGKTVQQLIDDGRIKAVYHMMSFLGPESVRAAEAAGCAADQGQFKKYHDILYSNQPEEKTGGFQQATLLQLAGQADLNNTKFQQCVQNNTYKKYVSKVEDNAGKRDVNATPTILVNGKQLTTNAQLMPDGFTAAVTAAAGTK